MKKQDKIRAGQELATVLCLKREPKRKDEPRYITTWGNKTALGLYLTVENIINGNY